MSYPNILSSGADTSDRTDYGRYSGTCPESLFVVDINRPESRLGKCHSLAEGTHISQGLAQRR